MRHGCRHGGIVRFLKRSGPTREAGTRAPVSRTPSDHDYATEKLMQSEQVEGVRAGSVRNSIPSSFNRYITTDVYEIVGWNTVNPSFVL